MAFEGLGVVVFEEFVWVCNMIEETDWFGLSDKEGRMLLEQEDVDTDGRTDADDAGLGLRVFEGIW